MEQFENECDKDELLFQAKFEDEFNKFYEENFVEKQPKILSNQVESETDFFEAVLVPKLNVLEPKSTILTNYILSLDQGVTIMTVR